MSRAEVRTLRPLCVDCQHAVRKGNPRELDVGDRLPHAIGSFFCRRVEVVSPVNGARMRVENPCYLERTEGKCGERADFFRQREKVDVGVDRFVL